MFPSLVHLLDYFLHKDRLYLVYEKLDCNLHHILLKNSGKGLPLSIIKRCSWDIVRALSFLATNRVVHGDLKMSNIMWNSNRGTFQLVDFGLSFMEGQQVRWSFCSRFKSGNLAFTCSYYWLQTSVEVAFFRQFHMPLDLVRDSKKVNIWWCDDHVVYETSRNSLKVHSFHVLSITKFKFFFAKSWKPQNCNQLTMFLTMQLLKPMGSEMAYKIIHFNRHLRSIVTWWPHDYGTTLPLQCLSPSSGVNILNT